MCCRIVVTAHFHFYFILCKKEHFNGILDEISLFSVTDSPILTDNVKIRSGGGAPRPDNTVFLQPSTPLSGIFVTGLGYENGEKLNSSYDVSFWDATLTDSYDEFFFELPYEELGNYKIYAEFTNSGLLIEDDWEITFPMEQVK